MRDLMAVTKALADEQRIRALLALRSGELCVCQLIELLGLAPSTVSKHLAILHQARLVEGRKEGRWMHYRLPDAGAPRLVRSALAWILDAAAREQRISADAKQLRAILKIEATELCCRQREAARA